jgi:hypothetical protein
MAYVNQQFFGAITANDIINENLVIITGSITAGSNNITNISALSTYDLNLLRVSQSVYSVSNGFTSSAYITNISASTITLSSTSSLSQGDTLGFSTPKGVYFFKSSSFTDPNNLITVNNISGSDIGKDYAIIAQAQRSGSLIIGRFHLYLISEVTHRSIENSKLSFFVKWGEPYSEEESGDIIRIDGRNLAIVDLTNINALAPEFNREIPGLENLPIGSDIAAWNIALNNYLSQFQSSLVLDNNFDNYLITATGNNTLNGESSLRFDGSGLIIGGTGNSQALLTITGSGDLVLIKNISGSGIKINNQGITQLLEYNGTPNAIGGGIYYSGSTFFIGID